jgi:ferredoxin
LPELTFLPDALTTSLPENTKLLVAARRAKLPIRFGCAACQCGTCGVKITSGAENLSAMKENEKSLLEAMHLSSDGSIRLSCQARIMSGKASVDLSFQGSYDPEKGLNE